MTRERRSTCDRCGGEAVTDGDGGVPVLECADCGNVLGLAGAAEPSPGPVRTGTVTATDGDLRQLVEFIRASGGGGPGGPAIAADRVLVETAVADLELTAVDGRVEIRERRADGNGDEDDDRT